MVTIATVVSTADEAVLSCWFRVNGCELLQDDNSTDELYIFLLIVCFWRPLRKFALI